MPRHPLSTSLKIRRLAPEVELPVFKTDGAAGMDLRAHLPDGAVGIQPGEVQMIPTGLIMEIEPGYEGQVRPRSGLAAKCGVTVLNSPGTIDSDYRGEVKVILINHGNEAFVVEDQERIAQLVIAALPRVVIDEVQETSSTERGVGGFGSTGKD